MKLYRSLWKLISFKPGSFLLILMFRIFYDTLIPQSTGLLIRLFFNYLGHNNKTVSFFITLLIGFFALAIGRFILTLIDIPIHVRTHFSIESLIRKNIFEYLLTIPAVQNLHESTGELLSRFRDDIEVISLFIRRQLLGFITSTLFAVFSFYIMIKINILAVIILIPVFFIVFISRFGLRWVKTTNEKARQSTADTTKFLGEILKNIETVKALTSEINVISEYNRINKKRMQENTRDVMLNEFFNLIFNNVIIVTTGIFLILFAKTMEEGKINIGDFTLFMFYFGYITSLSEQIGQALISLKKVKVSLNRLFSLYFLEDKQCLVKHSKIEFNKDFNYVFQPESNREDFENLVVDNVFYKYSKNATGLHNINFKLSKGSLNVVIGQVGVGKTTLLKVLLGLYPIKSGKIYWNGKNIQKPEKIMRPPNVAYTAQNPILFTASIKDNILLGYEYKEKRFKRAIKSAVLENDIDQLDEGIDTVVGPRGRKLSGGQLVRVALARMFYRASQVLFLDNVTSAFDKKTEIIFWNRLLELINSDNVTVLAVTNRNQIVKKCTQVILMKDGKATPKLL